MQFYPLLKSVSRSFYLSIRFLPKSLRVPVGVAYLLARATDTVADSATHSLQKRVEQLKMMESAILGQLSGDAYQALMIELASVGAVQSHEGEAHLLQEFDSCMAIFHGCEEAEQSLIREVLHTIITGQIWDLEYFEQCSSVQTNEELELYTYRVAGCVGEFWTKLSRLKLRDRFSVAPDKLLLDWGRHYGMALQLVNILRDRSEDEEKGRCYIPKTDKDWFAQAISWFDEADLYSDSLIDRRLRFATTLPAQLGRRTLEAMLNSHEPNTKIKITKKTVYSEMVKAIVMSFRWPQCDRVR